MTWAPLLLADPSPCLRILVLTELMGRNVKDSEVQELVSLRGNDPLVSQLFELQGKDGSWSDRVLLGTTPGGKLQTTAQVLTRLGYLGFGPANESVKRGAEYIFSKQRKDGSWPLPNVKDEQTDDWKYSMMPFQTSYPLIGLSSCGYATDSRSEKGYDWLVKQRLEDGSWPTGLAGKVHGSVARYRTISHSRWGCRCNTTAALLSLSLHPRRRTSNVSQRALDLLLGRDTKELQNVGYNVARIIGVEPVSGWTTFYAKYDLAQMLDLSSKVGADKSDERVAEIIKAISNVQGRYGLWQYASRPEASRWITFDILRSLSRLDKTTEWLSTEPRTPFQPIPRQKKRY